MKFIYTVLFCLSFVGLQAQHTLKYQENYVATKASLQDISWISGYWTGEAFGGKTEEIWSNPLGNSMMFSFKLVVDNQVKFYELGTITEKDNTLLLQLKHFDANLHGWEEKEETVDFKFIKLDGNKVFFDQFTFEKISDTEMNIYVVIHNNGKEKEAKFNYHKQ